MFASIPGLRNREHVTVARDFSVYSIVNVISLLLLLGTGLVLRRYLGPYLAGIWTGLEILPVYAAFAHLGVLNTAERELPYLIGARRLETFERLKHTLFWFTQGLGATVAVVTLGAAIALRGRTSRELFIGLAVYAPLLWVQVLSTYYVLLFRARKRFVDLSTRQGLANLLKALLTVVGGYAYGLYGVYAALLVAAAGQVALFHTAIDERFERTFDGRVLWPLLREGVPILLGALAFDTLRTADKLVIAASLGAESLGIYSVAALICQGVFYLPNAFAIVMYPRFQERYGLTKDPTSLRKFVELPLGILADGLLILVALVYAAVPPLIQTWLPQYRGSDVPLRIALFGTYFVSLTLPAGQFLLTVRKQVRALAIGLPAMLLTLGAGFAGARSGLTGIVIGCSIVYLLQFAALNAYALMHFATVSGIVRQLFGIVGTAAACASGLLVIDRLALLQPPNGSGVVAATWRLVLALALISPLAWRFVQRIRTAGRSEA